LYPPFSFSSILLRLVSLFRPLCLIFRSILPSSSPHSCTFKCEIINDHETGRDNWYGVIK
jgi:hypothetical protein